MLVTKVGARRDDTGSWLPAFSPEEIRSAVHDNLDRLGVEQLGGVNLRIMDGHEGPILPQWEVLAELQQEGKIAHLGLSTVTAEHLAEVRDVAPVAMVQNRTTSPSAATTPGSTSSRRRHRVRAVLPARRVHAARPHRARRGRARRHGATGRQVALAWLLQRSPNILLIPGTSSVAHLEENLAAADLELSADDVARLDALHPVG